MAVTMSDVASLAGVSAKTVSNVLNDYKYLRPETRARVEDAIRVLGYRMNVTARNLRAGRSGTIILAIPELTQPYFAELAQAVIDRAAEVNLNLFVETTGGLASRELSIASGDHLIPADGLIFSPQGMRPEEANSIKPGIPTVLLGERVFHSPYDHVTMANVEGAAAAVGHLLDAGRRRIAMLGACADEPIVGTGSLRLQGALAAYQQRGLVPPTDLVLYQVPWDRARGEAAVERLLDEGVEFDAVFGMNDALALGAERALLHRGVRIPADVAVVGFDDTLDAQYSTPSLTSIAPGRTEIARLAVELLHRRLTGEFEDNTHVELVAGFELMVRESSAS